MTGLLILGAIPAAAGTTRIELLSVDPRSPAGHATLTASPVMGPKVEDPPETLTTEVEIPGSVELELASGFTWRLQARAPGFWETEILVQGGASHPGAFRLVPTATLRARLALQPGTDAPPSLGVRLRPSETGGSSARGVDVTQVDCQVELDQLSCGVPAGAHDFRVHAQGFIAHYFWSQAVAPATVHDLGALELVPGASISGWLETDDDSPVEPGTSVTAVPQATPAEDPTALRKRLGLARKAGVNDQGFFHFSSGLPPGAYQLEATQQGFAPSSSPPVVVTEGSETELAEPLVLTRPAELRIAVDPPFDGQGLPWSLLLLAHGTTMPAAAGNVGPDGVWTASQLGRGTYTLTVTDSKGSRVRGEEVEVETGSQEHWVDLDLIAIEGRVTLGDEPLPAELAFGGASGMTSVIMVANDEGRFEGSLPRTGAWQVDVRSRAFGVHRRLRAVEVEPVAGSSRARVEIDLPGTRLEGEVVDPSGRGIERATVMSLPVPKKAGDPAERVSHTRTGRGGIFAFEGFEPAAYRLQAVRFVDGVKQVSPSVEVLLEEAAPFQSVRLVLGGQTTLEGRVLSENGGVPGAKILARSIGGIDLVLPNAITDTDGRFRLNLAEGARQAKLTILAPGFVFYQETVPVPESDELPVHLGQDHGGTLIIESQGPIEFGSGQPLPYVLYDGQSRIDLTILSQWSALHPKDRASSGATMELPRMPQGAYAACWPGASKAEDPRIEHDCQEGFLPARGRLELVQRAEREQSTANADSYKED